MGMAAILVMWPGPFEQSSVPPSQGSLILIRPVVSEEMFEKFEGRRKHAYTISSTVSLKAEVSEKVWHTHTNACTSQKQYAPPTFQSWGLTRTCTRKVITQWMEMRNECIWTLTHDLNKGNKIRFVLYETDLWYRKYSRQWAQPHKYPQL